ncbi:MAG: hypothetical protein ACXW39_05515 [Nitrospira sp.]
MSGVALLRRVISQITIHYLDTRRDHDELVLAAVGLCETLLKTLFPLLGKGGSLALFRRSLKLTEETFPCYRGALSAEEDGILHAVGACLRRQKMDAAREATITLLLTFVELLATFIGERLTWQLLQEAWPDILTVSSEEKSQ